MDPALFDGSICYPSELSISPSSNRTNNNESLQNEIGNYERVHLLSDQEHRYDDVEMDTVQT